MKPGSLKVERPSSLLSLFIGLFSLAMAGIIGIFLGRSIDTSKTAQAPTPVKYPSPSPKSQKKLQITALGNSASTVNASRHACPSKVWIDCTSTIKRQGKECTKEFLTWATSTCPGVKGAEY